MEKLSRPQFSKSFSGYKAEEVDTYIDKLLKEISSLQVMNETLEEKIGVLAESVQNYREDEDSLREALLGAQKMADGIIKNANNKAEIAMREASIKAAHILQEAHQKVEDEKNELVRVQEEVADFKAKLINMYREHIEGITRIPAVEKETSSAEDTIPVEEEFANSEEPVEETMEITEPLAAADTAEEIMTEEIAESSEPVEELLEEEPAGEEEEFSEDAESTAEKEELEEESSIPELGRDIFEEFERKKSEILNFSHSDKPAAERRSKFSDLKFGDGFNLLDDEDF